MRKKTAALVLALVLTLAMAGCSSQQKGNPAASADDRPAVTVSTGCGDLFFPEEWGDLVTVEETEKAYGTSVTFSADNDGEPVSLFTLNIGGGEGDEVGTLKGPDGTERPVHMAIGELMLEGADEETANRLFAMQEDVNFIIEHLD